MSMDRRQDIMGVLVAIFGMVMCAVMYARHDLTLWFLLVWMAVIAFGAYLVSPMATHSAIADGASLAERFGWRAGRRVTDPMAVPTEPVTPVVVTPNVIVEPARPIQPEIAQRPTWARPATPESPEEIAVPVEPPPPKPKRPPRPPKEPSPDDGEEFGAEQIDAADVPEKHEHLDYRPLGLMAMPEAGQGDKRVGRFFVLGEFAVSGSHPELVKPIPKKLIPQVIKLASTCLDPIRTLAGRPVTVLSGYRDARLNAAVGGSPTSQHLYAAAADITCDGIRLMFESLLGGSLQVPCGQTIWYEGKNFFHIALPGWRYRSPTFQVHAPARGLRYRTVTSVKEFRDLIAEHR